MNEIAQDSPAGNDNSPNRIRAACGVIGWAIGVVFKLIAVVILLIGTLVETAIRVLSSLTTPPTF